MERGSGDRVGRDDFIETVSGFSGFGRGFKGLILPLLLVVAEDIDEIEDAEECEDDGHCDGGDNFRRCRLRAPLIFAELEADSNDSRQRFLSFLALIRLGRVPHLGD